MAFLKKGQFKNVELAVRLSQNLMRNADGTLKVGKKMKEPKEDTIERNRKAAEAILSELEGVDKRSKLYKEEKARADECLKWTKPYEVDVLYGTTKTGEERELENIQLDIFIRNDVEGQQQAYPSLAYKSKEDREAEERRTGQPGQGGPKAEWYKPKELLSIEREWAKTADGAFAYGRANVMNTTSAFNGPKRINHLTVGPPEVAFDLELHNTNKAAYRAEFKAARAARANPSKGVQASVQTPVLTAQQNAPKVNIPQATSELEMIG